MEFFGITYCGPQDYIKDLMRPDYKEPMSEPEVKPMIEKVFANTTCQEKAEVDVDTIRLIDCYSGTVNGFAYGSTVRFKKMKTKGVLKPFAPADMYRLPPTSSIDIGWWHCDPALTNESWHKLRNRFPQPKSPNTMVLEKVLVNNKYACLF